MTVNIEFMWRGLETGERTSFNESLHPFRAEPHKFYIYRQSVLSLRAGTRYFYPATVASGTGRKNKNKKNHVQNSS